MCHYDSFVQAGSVCEGTEPSFLYLDVILALINIVSIDFVIDVNGNKWYPFSII